MLYEVITGARAGSGPAHVALDRPVGCGHAVADEHHRRLHLTGTGESAGHEIASHHQLLGTTGDRQPRCADDLVELVV